MCLITNQKVLVNNMLQSSHKHRVLNTSLQQLSKLNRRPNIKRLDQFYLLALSKLGADDIACNLKQLLIL